RRSMCRSCSEWPIRRSISPRSAAGTASKWPRSTSCCVTPRRWPRPRTGAPPKQRSSIEHNALARLLLGFLNQGQRAWSFADNEHPCLLVLGAIPVHLFGKMRDETTGAHRRHVLLVGALVAGGHPPGALDHGDEAVVGMEMRLAEIARLEPVEHDVGSA